MNMDNDQIEKLFNDLKKYVEKNIEEGKEDHKEIQKGIRNLCDRMTKQETMHEEQKLNALNKRGWVGVAVALLAISFTIINIFFKIV